MTPLHQLPAKELKWLATHRCKHQHTLLEHYNCHKGYKEERIGFLDIEFYNFDANYGRMITYCIKDSQSKKIYFDTVTQADIKKGEKTGTEDKRVVKHLMEDMKQFDRIVTFYGQRCDIPYIRTRALMCGLDFFSYGELTHTDLYFIARYKLKLNRNALEVVCRSLLGKTEKTHVENSHWMRAMRGDKESINYILDHNKRDVRDTERVYHKIIKFIRKTNTSI
jgi:uncharacterized protein YprB with RNaseH-like and TPR domain